MNPIIVNKRRMLHSTGICPLASSSTPLPLYPSPRLAIPKKDGRARVSIKCKKLNNISEISSLGRIAIPRVDEVLDSLGQMTHTSPVRPRLLIPSGYEYHQQGYHSPYRLLNTRPTFLGDRFDAGQQRRLRLSC